eukprot:12954302-Alexandrium_andersonii.AAC.1
MKVTARMQNTVISLVHRGRPEDFPPARDHACNGWAIAKTHNACRGGEGRGGGAVSYTHLRAHETSAHL